MLAYLEPIIVRADSQAARVDRLVAYAKDLDGTEITVLRDAGPNLPYPLCNNAAFHVAASYAKGKRRPQPWLWLEPDAIPTRAGWLRDLTTEYRKVGQPFLLPDMSNAHRLDTAAGIGVYPEDSSWLIPKIFEKDAWDLWMSRHLDPVIGRTRLIQHSYGVYGEEFAEPHRFPRDSAILRPETVLFHRDLHQDLITEAGFAPLPIALDSPIPEPVIITL